ncbi:AMP deaminase [Coelomomyces lativittatus]|nr:AMP deaminase [Coelomomyces lativittatus]KAJ1508333.1 AMP deaminase [Coelomomyces lativittatus]
MELAVQTCSIKKIKGLFYSRKSFRYPESQPWPHSSWQAEVDLLDSYFGNGASYVMGNTTSEPWYLYVLDERPIPNRVLQSILPLPYASNVAPSSLLTSSLNHSYLLSVIEDDKEASEIYTSEIHDHTLEILMTGLCPEKMQRYFYAHSPPSKSLHNWIPGLLTDSYQFDPCGWSQNGLLNSIYTTIHVTPEAESSYASFETNLPQPDTSMIQSLLNIFSPSNITLTLFIPRKQGLLPSSVPAMVLLPGYQLVDLMINVLPKHYLFYGRYVLEENNN